MSNIRSFAVFLCALGLAAAALAQDKDSNKVDIDVSKLPPVSSKTGVTYDTDIKPIFEKSCFPCHNAKNPKPKGGLRLDSLAAVLKGGEDGPAIVVGNSAKSALVANVAHLGDEDDYMPPPKNRAHLGPLTSEQIGLIRAWIDQGAK
jgi:hypothetical protein